MRRLPVLMALAASGCFLPSFEKVDDTNGGGGVGGAGGSAPCDLAAPPGAPETPPPGGEIEFYAAVHTVDAGDAHLPTRPGYDLDGVCSCCSTCDRPTCAPPMGATTEPCDAVDGNDNAGRDNNIAKYMAAIDGIQPELTSQPMSTRADQGSWSIIVRVSEYNGEPDDGVVTVALYGTNGATVVPTWMGDDVWSVRRDFVGGSGSVDEPLVVKADAYVVDGTLVASFSPAPLTIALPLNLVVILEEAHFQAKISKDALDNFQLDQGLVTGRWRITDALTALGGMKTMGFAIACTNFDNYGNYKTPLCQLLDESTVGGPGPCDALSFGLGFTANQISSVPVVQDFDTSRLCEDGADPAGDTCN